MNLQKKLTLIYISEFFVFFHIFGGVLIPFYTIWGGISLAEVMLLQAWFSFCVLMFEIPTGTLADRLGRKNTIMIGLAIWTTGIMIYGSFSSFWMFFLAEFFWALAAALFSGAKEALVYDTLLDHKASKQSQQAFGRFKMSHLWGLMISAPIGSWIGQHYGLNWPMILMFIPAFFAFLFLFFVPEPKSARSISIDDPTPSSRPQSWQSNRPNFRRQISEGWQFFRSHPYLRIMTFDMVTLWSLSFMIVWFYQVALEKLDVDIKYFGWFITFALLFQLIVIKLFPWMEKVLGSKKRLLFLSGILPGIGFLLMAIFPSIISVIFGLLFCSGFGLSRRTLYSSYMNKFISSSQRATVNSFINIGIHVVALLIKPALGYLADYSFTSVLVFLGTSIILISLFSRVEESMLLD